MAKTLSTTGLPPRVLRRAAGMLRAAAHPTRLKIIELLMSAGPLSVSALTDRLRADQPTVSAHLRELRAANIVDARRDGRRRIYRLTNPDAAAVVQAIQRHHFRSVSFEGGEAI